MATISTIEQIGPPAIRALRDVGVRTTEALLDTGADPIGRRALASATGLPADDLLAWVHTADLMRVQGVSRRRARLLATTGVTTVPDLARRDPQALVVVLAEVVRREASATTRRAPSLGVVADWVTQAATLPPVVTD